MNYGSSDGRFPPSYGDGYNVHMVFLVILLLSI